MAPKLYKSVAFDAPRDVAGVALLGASPLVLVVNPSFAAKSVGELIAMAKAKPGEINYGSGGVATRHTWQPSCSCSTNGIRMTHVAYRGEAPAVADVSRPAPAAVRQCLRGDRAGEGRHPAGARRHLAQARTGLPDVPTLAEAGVKDSDVETSWTVAPNATPREIVERLNAEVRKAFATPELQQRFAELSLSVTPSSPEELDALIKSETVRWDDVIRRAGIRPMD